MPEPWEPDVLLPYQHRALHQGREAAPERRLLLAVLAHALNDLEQALRGGPAANRDEILDWFFRPDRRWLFSFENICAYLDLDAGYLRRRLAARFRDALGPPPVAESAGRARS